MFNIYKFKLTILQEEILRFLFANNGKEFNARTIARSLGVSSPAVLKSISNLKKSEMIEVDKDRDSGRLSIRLSDRQEVINLKRVDNLRAIYESGLYDYLDKEFPGRLIILFGSYSRGEDSIDSDIDVVIIGGNSKEVSIEKHEKIFNKKININFYNNLRDIHKHLRENILNGIVLKGGIEL